MTVDDRLLSQIRAAGLDLWIEERQLRYRMPKTQAANDALALVRTHKPDIEAWLQARVLPMEDMARQILGLRKSQQNAPHFPMRVEHMWRVEYRRDGSAPNIAFDVPYAMPLGRDLPLEGVRQAVMAMVERHAALRTRVTVQDERPVQVVGTPGRFTMDIAALADGSPAALQQAMKDLGTPHIDLKTEDGFRSRLFHAPGGNITLGLLWHHYCCDYRSMLLFGQEIRDRCIALRRGETASFPPIEIQYADYALAQRQSLSANLSETLRYWQGALAGVEPARLPHDHDLDTKNVFSVYYLIPPELGLHIKAQARKLRIGFFAVLFAAYQLTLARWSGSRRVTNAVSVADRFEPQYAATLGYLICALPISTLVRDEMSVEAYFEYVARDVAEAYPHRALSYESFDQIFEPPRPFCTTLFNFYTLKPMAEDAAHAGRMDVTFGEPVTRNLHHREIYFELVETAEGIRGRMLCNADHFSPASIETMVRRYVNMLEQMAASPAARLGELA